MTGDMILEALFQPEEVRMRSGGPGGRCADDDPRTCLSESAAPDSPSAEPGDSPGNELSGVVHGSAVQARSIQGGVHFSVTQAGPAAMPVPAQLPPAAAHFTGRSEELASLDQATAEYDPARRLAVAVISGAGGAGKTSLASYWLHRISDRYEGGLLYADLHGHVPDAATRPGEVLTGFLAALGRPPEWIPFGLGEQAKLYRSLTSGQRMLVLLDNAASAAQVRALLPGPGPRGTPEQHELPSLVVVTTRWRIAGLAMDGARFIELGPLDDTSGVELLGRIVGAERAAAEADAVRTVVRLCGGLPLAVCVAGAKLASHTRWPIGRIAAELAGEQDRLAVLSISDDVSVRAAFDVSYQALPAAAARLYRLLSLIPGPHFSAELATTVAGISHQETTGLLDALTEASLLEETSERRFLFHDLVKLHAREQAQIEPARERTAAAARAVGWYLLQAVAADLVIIPGRWRLNPMYEQARASPPGYDGPLEALRWMESELPGLLAAVRTAHDEGLYEQAWQLCEAMWGLFAYRKYFGHWIDAHVLGLASAHACGDLRAEARMRVQLGHAYLNLGRQEQAREEFIRSLALAREEGYQLGAATALENVGLADLSLGKPDEAIGAFTEAREIFLQIGVLRGVLGLTRHIGEAHRDAGRHGQAVRHLLEARRLSAALPDHYNEARCLTSLGDAYLRAAQPEDAVRSLDEAFGIMVSLGGRYEQARIRASLAEALLRLGQGDLARDHLAGALAVYSDIDAPEAGEIRRRLSELGPADDAGPGGGPS
jgi:tetratricopeptide (TPR) repeat protein